MPELIIKLGDNIVQKYFFVNEPMSIGRAPDNEIVIENLAISRNHAVITATDGAFLIKDLGSSNGTFVNGSKVQQALLTDKDVIGIGKHKLHFYNARPVHETARPSFADADSTMVVTQIPVTAELEQIRGKHQATLYPLNAEITRLGRGAQNDIRLTDWFVSKEHATVTRMEDVFVLRDLGSWRHTFVNGERIEEAVLRHGDVIQVGPTVQFRFAVTSGMDAHEAPAPPRLNAIAMPTYEAPSESAAAQFSPAFSSVLDSPYGSPANGSAADLEPVALPAEPAAFFPADGMTARFEPQPELQPERLEDIVEKIASVSVRAAAEALSTDPHPEPARAAVAAEDPAPSHPLDFGPEPAAEESAEHEPEAEIEAQLEAEAEPAGVAADEADWTARFAGADDEPEQRTMRLANPDEFARIETPFGEAAQDAAAEPLPEPQDEPTLEPGDAVAREEDFVTFCMQFNGAHETEADPAAGDEPANLAPAAEPSPFEFEEKNDFTAEQPELAQVAVAADTESSSGENASGEEVRIWERALQNRSVVIRKQAARKLKQLTGKDYDY